MVYSDISDANAKFNSNPNKKKLEPALFRASVIDRFFSFLLDYLIFSPVVSFFLITFFQEEVVIWKSGQARAENFPILLMLGISYVLIFSLLQSFFIYFWGGSPGQYFLKLKVKIEPQPGLIFLRIWLRQIGFWFSCFFLGLPWLAILAHPTQRPFYDRLSETGVFSLKQNQKYFSFEGEAKYWRSLLGTLVVFLMVVFIGFGWQQHNQIKLGAFSFYKFNKKDMFCAQMKTVELKDRLQTAVALNLVGQLSDECMDKEAEYVLWTVQDEALQSLAYYAKSLTEESSSDEKRYQQQACQFKGQDYFGCRVANAFLKKDIRGFYAALKTDKNEKNLLASVLQYELGMVLNQTSEEDENFKSLKKFDKQKIVKKYLLSELMDRRLLATTAKSSTSKGRGPASVKKTEPSSSDVKYAQKLIDQM